MSENMAEIILQNVDQRGHINSLELANELKVDHQKIVGAIKSLQSFGEVCLNTWCKKKLPTTYQQTDDEMSDHRWCNDLSNNYLQRFSGHADDKLTTILMTITFWKLYR